MSRMGWPTWAPPPRLLGAGQAAAAADLAERAAQILAAGRRGAHCR